MDFWKIFTFNELSFLNHLTNWAGIKFGSLIRIFTFRFNKFHTYLRPFFKKSAPEAMSKGQNRVIDRFFHLKLAAISEPLLQFSWNKFLFSCLSLHFYISKAHARKNSFRQRKWPITDQKSTKLVKNENFYFSNTHKIFYFSPILWFFGQLLAIFFVETSSFVREPY